MKRTLKNIALWLIAAALLAVLYFGILHPQKLQQLKSQISPARESNISQLMQKKNELEQQKAALLKEKNEQSLAPSSVFVLFVDLDETVIREAAELLEKEDCKALLGITEEDLLLWGDQGVSALVTEKLEDGWELCLILEKTSPSIMQAQLGMLHLPKAKAAYQLGDVPVNEQNGIDLILDYGMKPQEEKNDDLWHIPALGNMNRASLEMYNSKKGAGDGVAFLIGSADADQRYSRDNLEALVELIRQDRQDQLMQCVSVAEAHTRHRERLEKLLPLQAEWDRQLKTLEQQLNSILRQITSSDGI